MRAEIYDGLIRVTISERNALAMIYRLRQQAGTRGLQGSDIHIRGMAVAGFKLQLAIEPDDVHYGDREPGELDLAVESFIEEESSVANPDRHRVGYLLDLHLAPSGRMICGSKSAFRHAYPTRAPIFNGNIFVLEHGTPVKVWHGDLDLTVDESRLVRIAAVCQQTLLILWEKDGRFAGRDREPRLHEVALRIEPDGSTMLDEDQFWRAEDGTIRSQPEPSRGAAEESA